MSKKKNPVINMRASEVRKLKAECTQEAIEATMAIFLTVMHDKEGYGLTRLRRLHKKINDYAELVAQGYVTIEKLKKALLDEMGIRITFKPSGKVDEESV
jgi:hypothetical protein